MSEHTEPQMNEQDYSYPMLMLKSAYKDAEAALLRKDYSAATTYLASAVIAAGEAMQAVERIRE
jgi:hypothetical protein